MTVIGLNDVGGACDSEGKGRKGVVHGREGPWDREISKFRNSVDGFWGRSGQTPCFVPILMYIPPFSSFFRRVCVCVGGGG